MSLDMFLGRERSLALYERSEGRAIDHPHAVNRSGNHDASGRRR